MPTPNFGTPIKMSDVQNETNLVPNMFNFFAISQIGGGGGLMYHNLGMGVTGNATAKQEIYDPFVAGPTGGPVNLTLGAWYSYDQTPNGILNMTFTNNNPDFNVDCIIYLTDPTGGFNQVYTTPTLTAGGGNDVQINYDTGLAMDTATFLGGVYWIEMSCTCPNTPPPPYNMVSTTITNPPTDTDGVGAGTARSVGPAIPLFDNGTPLARRPIVQGNIGGNNGIYINKRTTFIVTFT